MTQEEKNRADYVGRLFGVLHDRMGEFFAGDQGIDKGDKDLVAIDAEAVVDACLSIIGSVMADHPQLKETMDRKLFCVETAFKLDGVLRAAQMHHEQNGSPYEGVRFRKDMH